MRGHALALAGMHRVRCAITSGGDRSSPPRRRQRAHSARRQCGVLFNARATAYRGADSSFRSARTGWSADRRRIVVAGKGRRCEDLWSSYAIAAPHQPVRDLRPVLPRQQPCLGTRAAARSHRHFALVISHKQRLDGTTSKCQSHSPTMHPSSGIVPQPRVGVAPKDCRGASRYAHDVPSETGSLT